MIEKSQNNPLQELEKNLKTHEVDGKFTDLQLANIHELGFDFKQEGGITPEDANAKISGRFDAEVQKAGLGSYDTPGLTAIKEQFNTAVQQTPDMEDKLKLYSAFMEELAGKVGTTVAEENKIAKLNAENMDNTTKTHQESTQEHFKTVLKLAQDLRELRDKANNKRLAQEQAQQQEARNG